MDKLAKLEKRIKFLEKRIEELEVINSVNFEINTKKICNNSLLILYILMHEKVLKPDRLSKILELFLLSSKDNKLTDNNTLSFIKELVDENIQKEMSPLMFMTALLFSSDDPNFVDAGNYLRKLDQDFDRLITERKP